MALSKDLDELVQAQVISQQTADEITAYYASKKEASGSSLFVIFGVLGAILVGLGIILIIAHNWDHLSRLQKTILAFVPLVSAQGFCAFSLIRKRNNQRWVESSAAFLFFSLAAAIAMIGQIYNIPGDLPAFLMTWMLLSLPMIYILKSSMLSMLYLIGITGYGAETGYSSQDPSEWYYWAMLLGALPHYYLLLKKHPKGYFTHIHHWLIALSLTTVLGTVAHSHEELMFIAYCSLFGLFYAIGHFSLFQSVGTLANGYKLIGALGTLIILLILSFEEFWSHLSQPRWQLPDVLSSSEFLVGLLITLAATWVLSLRIRKVGLPRILPMEWVFLLFIPTYMVGFFSGISVLIINLIILTLGILTVRQGAREAHLGLLNYGLIIVTMLIVSRFFDDQIPFVWRGILFVLVGIGFFIANYWMLKKRKENV